MLSQSVWANIAQGNHLCNHSMQCWPIQLKDNFFEENSPYNVVSTMLGQHCIEILFSQCCPNTSETTLHKKNYLCNIDLEHTDIISLENRLFEIFLVACFLTGCNISPNNLGSFYLFNVWLRSLFMASRTAMNRGQH